MTTSVELLLSCLRSEVAEKKLAWLRKCSAEDWKQVIAIADKHMVVPLLFHNLRSIDSGLDIPSDLRVKMREIYYLSAARNMRLYRELSKILALFNSQKIPLVVLKGAYLAEAVYGNIALRGMGDVDILVRKEDLLRVEEILLSAGGEPESEGRLFSRHSLAFAYLMVDSGLRLDIHWALSPSFYSSQIDTEAIWSRALPVKIEQFNVRALSPEDLLLHLCWHTAKHAHYIEILSLCDIAQVLSYYQGKLDWPMIKERARQWRILRAAYVFIRMAHEMLGAAVTPEQLALIRPEDFDEEKFSLSRRQILAVEADHLASGIPQPVAKLWQIKGLPGKIAFFRERFPVMSEHNLKNNSGLHSWRIYFYYPARLGYLIKKYGGSIWRLVRGDKKARTAAARANEINALRDWLMSG